MLTPNGTDMRYAIDQHGNTVDIDATLSRVAAVVTQASEAVAAVLESMRPTFEKVAAWVNEMSNDPIIRAVLYPKAGLHHPSGRIGRYRRQNHR